MLGLPEAFFFPYSITISALNIVIFCAWVFELVIRKVEWCLLPAAYLMAFCSTLFSVASSLSFFFANEMVVSSTAGHWFCKCAPVFAIVCKFLAKNCMWGFFIVRARMVMSSLNSPILSKIARKAPAFLVCQALIVSTLVCALVNGQHTHVHNDVSVATHCNVTFPLWLLIIGGVMGELIYGLGFTYLFWRGMSDSLDHVYSSLSVRDRLVTYRQMVRHFYLFSAQALISFSFYAIVIWDGIRLQSLCFWEADILFGNLCILSLFQGRKHVCAEFWGCDEGKSDPLQEHRHFSRMSAMRISRSQIVGQYSAQSNYYLPNRWKGHEQSRLERIDSFNARHGAGRLSRSNLAGDSNLSNVPRMPSMRDSNNLRRSGNSLRKDNFADVQRFDISLHSKESGDSQLPLRQPGITYKDSMESFRLAERRIMNPPKIHQLRSNSVSNTANIPRQSSNVSSPKQPRTYQINRVVKPTQPKSHIPISPGSGDSSEQPSIAEECTTPSFQLSGGVATDGDDTPNDTRTIMLNLRACKNTDLGTESSVEDQTSSPAVAIDLDLAPVHVSDPISDPECDAKNSDIDPECSESLPMPPIQITAPAMAMQRSVEMSTQSQNPMIGATDIDDNDSSEDRENAQPLPEITLTISQKMKRNLSKRDSFIRAMKQVLTPHPKPKSLLEVDESNVDQLEAAEVHRHKKEKTDEPIGFALTVVTEKPLSNHGKTLEQFESAVHNAATSSDLELMSFGDNRSRSESTLDYVRFQRHHRKFLLNGVTPIRTDLSSDWHTITPLNVGKLTPASIGLSKTPPIIPVFDPSHLSHQPQPSVDTTVKQRKENNSMRPDLPARVGSPATHSASMSIIDVVYNDQSKKIKARKNIMHLLQSSVVVATTDVPTPTPVKSKSPKKINNELLFSDIVNTH